MPTTEHECPVCGRGLTDVEDAPGETFDVPGTTNQMAASHASRVYACPEHGRWTIDADGHAQKETGF